MFIAARISKPHGTSRGFSSRNAPPLYLFQRGRGFSGWSSVKAEFDAVVKIGDWRVHDLRRTVRTGIDKLGTLPHICEAVLNHLPPKLVRTYNRNTYENEKRKALDTWAHHLKTIVAQATGANVTALKRDRKRPRYGRTAMSKTASFFEI